MYIKLIEAIPKGKFPLLRYGILLADNTDRRRHMMRLETERLTLRPFDITDAEAMHQNWASDPDVVRRNFASMLYAERSCGGQG